MAGLAERFVPVFGDDVARRLRGKAACVSRARRFRPVMSTLKAVAGRGAHLPMPAAAPRHDMRRIIVSAGMKATNHASTGHDVIVILVDRAGPNQYRALTSPIL